MAQVPASQSLFLQTLQARVCICLWSLQCNVPKFFQKPSEVRVCPGKKERQQRDCVYQIGLWPCLREIIRTGN